jgi:hypothetical protein
MLLNEETQQLKDIDDQVNPNDRKKKAKRFQSSQGNMFKGYFMEWCQSQFH